MTRIIIMKKSFIFTAIILLVVVFSSFDQIKLKAPDLNGGKALLTAMKNRKSDRVFQNKALSDKHLSELMWAAYGVNRENGKRTVPSARAMYPLRIYAVTQNGIYLYNPQKHVLEGVKEGDYRKYCGTQPFVATAPLNIIIVSDYSRLGDMNDQQKAVYSALDAAHCCQNVYLYCASEGLKVVERAMVNDKELLKQIGLDSNFHFVISQTVGY